MSNSNEFLIFLYKLFIGFGVLTPMFSIILMFSYNIFKKAKLNTSIAFLPIVNLIYFNKIAEISIWYSILYFVPVVNLIYFFYVLYKVSTSFKTSNMFYVGMMLLPIFFLPILAFGDFKYKKEEQKEENMLEDVKDESINLLTQKEYEELNNEKVNENKIDSLYKSDWDIVEKPKPYKAVETKTDKDFNETELVDVTTIKRVQPTRFEEPPKVVEKEPEEEKIETIDFDS